MELIKLVIVEDDAMVLEVNRQFIEMLDGFQIIGTAKTGQEAKKLIVESNPQVVLLDFYLPDTNGLEIIKYIRECGIDTDFILVTAAKDVDTIQQVLRYGAIDYIIKPFRFERLKTSMSRYQQMLNRIKINEELDQRSLDNLTIIQETSFKESELPKGLNEITMKQILNYMLKTEKPLSAGEVAKGIGLARVTARRYLEYLEKNNRLNLDIQYGSVGRPINRYSV